MAFKTSTDDCRRSTESRRAVPQAKVPNKPIKNTVITFFMNGFLGESDELREANFR